MITGRIGHLLATGYLTAQEAEVWKAELARVKTAANAWLAVEIPKLKAKLAAWADAVPLQSTEASRAAEYQKVSAISNAYSTASRAFAAPYEASVGDQPISALPQLDQAYRDAIAPYVPLIQLATQVGAQTPEICAAKGMIWHGTVPPGYANPIYECRTQAEVTELQKAAAWAEWTLQSGPLFAELAAIAKETREPFYQLDLTQLDRADELRASLLAMAQQLLGAYGGPAVVGGWMQRNLARAQEMIGMAWEQANGAVLSAKKVRDMAVAAGGETGSGFRFGFPLAILAGIAAVVLIRRARSS